MSDDETQDGSAMVGRSKWLTHDRLAILRRDYPTDHPWEGHDGILARLAATKGPPVPKKGIVGFVTHSFGIRRPKHQLPTKSPEEFIWATDTTGRTPTDRKRYYVADTPKYPLSTNSTDVA